MGLLMLVAQIRPRVLAAVPLAGLVKSHMGCRIRLEKAVPSVHRPSCGHQVGDIAARSIPEFLLHELPLRPDHQDHVLDLNRSEVTDLLKLTAEAAE